MSLCSLKHDFGHTLCCVHYACIKLGGTIWLKVRGGKLQFNIHVQTRKCEGEKWKPTGVHGQEDTGFPGKMNSSHSLMTWLVSSWSLTSRQLHRITSGWTYTTSEYTAWTIQAAWLQLPPNATENSHTCKNKKVHDYGVHWQATEILHVLHMLLDLFSNDGPWRSTNTDQDPPMGGWGWGGIDCT